MQILEKKCYMSAIFMGQQQTDNSLFYFTSGDGVCFAINKNI